MSTMMVIVGGKKYSSSWSATWRRACQSAAVCSWQLLVMLVMGCDSVLRLLLRAKGGQLEVTEDVLRAARGEQTGVKYSQWAWKLLLGSNATFEVTDNTLVMAWKKFSTLRLIRRTRTGKRRSSTTIYKFLVRAVWRMVARGEFGHQRRNCTDGVAC